MVEEVKCSDRCTPHTSPSLAVERLKDEREERSYFTLDERELASPDWLWRNGGRFRRLRKSMNIK